MNIDDLRDNPSYTLLLMLPHDNALSFVEKQIRGKTVIVRTYIIFNLLLLTTILLLAALDIWQGHLTFLVLLKYFGIGSILVFTVLIPVHEGLHGLAYKIIGAPEISFGANWRKFYFYAVANRFLVNKKAFLFVALLPFLVISLVVLALLIFATVHLKWALLSIFLLHSAACAGDFAMLGFYEEHRYAKELLTYDDVEQKRSYFYVRE